MEDGALPNPVDPVVNLPGPDEALDCLRQAEEYRLGGGKGVPVDTVFAAMAQLRAKYAQKV